MTSFLFWNLQGRREKNRERRTRNLLASLTRLCRNRNLDVLLFSECFIEPHEVLEVLNLAGVGTYRFLESVGQRIRVFTRLPETAVREVFADRVHDRLTIREVQVERALPILLVGIHFHDRMRLPDEGGRALVVTEMARAIVQTEEEAGHSRTLLVGDLNMNP